MPRSLLCAYYTRVSRVWQALTPRGYPSRQARQLRCAYTMLRILRVSGVMPDSVRCCISNSTVSSAGHTLMDDGTYLDTDKVTIAISTLEDTDVAAALTALLQTYETALASGDRTVTQTAFRALLDAMETAGLQV